MSTDLTVTDQENTTAHLPDPLLLAQAQRHVHDIVRTAVAHTAAHQALIVGEARCVLAATLSKAYQLCIPEAQFIDFDTVAPQTVLDAFATLQPGDLVVLVQSTHFRLEAYRLRVELFKRGLKVIEHPHLSRMQGEEVNLYIDALAYDSQYYRGVGRALKQRIDVAQRASLDSGGAILHFDSPFEAAKLNIGDYSDMPNVGGQFPIGEVFTEAQNLEAVHGEVRVFVFGDANFRANRPETPITLIIEKGRVVDVRNSTPEFDQVMNLIREDEGQIWVRELGFGMNRSFSHERMVRDIGTYERMCGIHLSLGAKHGVYSKPQIRRTTAKYHIDVFPITEAVYLDDERVYANGAWTV